MIERTCPKNATSSGAVNRGFLTPDHSSMAADDTCRRWPLSDPIGEPSPDQHTCISADWAWSCGNQECIGMSPVLWSLLVALLAATGSRKPDTKSLSAWIIMTYHSLGLISTKRSAGAPERFTPALQILWCGRNKLRETEWIVIRKSIRNLQSHHAWRCRSGEIVACLTWAIDGVKIKAFLVLLYFGLWI